MKNDSPPYLYRHKKRGKLYEPIGAAAIQSETNLIDGDLVYLYRDINNGSLWARKHDEFFDGRFQIEPNLCAPNKPAEVDLDAMTPLDALNNLWACQGPNTVPDAVYFKIKDALSGHLATGKGGGELEEDTKKVIHLHDNGWKPVFNPPYEDTKYTLSKLPEGIISSAGFERLSFEDAVTVQRCLEKLSPAATQPAATAQIDTVDKWEPLKISNGYQYPAQSGEYIVRMIDGAELRSQYDGRFFRRKDNCDKIIPAHEIVCFKAIRAAPTQIDAGELERAPNIGSTDSWQSIDSCPSLNPGGGYPKVWIYGGRYGTPELVTADGDWWRWHLKNGETWPPTYWMPHYIPEPPK